jgi:predicted dehydrogenase
MNTLRVGFIGTGRISTVHALEYLSNERAKIVAVSDVDPTVAHQRAAAWGVPENRVYSDYHDLLALPDVDMVEILLPHHLHLRATLDAAAAGKHISLQKPMANSLAEADEMVAAAKQAGVMFKVFENFIFFPPMQRAKALVEAGEIGDPITIRIKTTAGTSPNAWEVPASSWAWRRDRKQAGGGGWVTDDGHHMYALAWYFMGLAEQVHTWAGENEIVPGEAVDDPAIVSWKFPGNRFGSWEAVIAPQMVLNTDYYAADDRLEITGTKGIIWVTRGHGKMLDIPPVILFRDRQLHGFSDMPVGWEQGFVLSTRHFIEAYFKGEPPCLTGEQGRDILRWCIAAEESARTGQRVRL